MTQLFRLKAFAHMSLVLAVASLPLVLSACAALGLASIGTQAAQGVVAVAGYSAIQVGQSKADRHTPGQLDDQEERCEGLVGAPPGVEELRKTKQDVIEAREWKLIDPGKPHWVIVRTKTSPEDAWEPKPRITNLQFKPPLVEQLDYKKTQFLAYAPNNLDNIEDSRDMTSVTEAFGDPFGTFEWHGKTYGYTMVSQLPCFPVEKD